MSGSVLDTGSKPYLKIIAGNIVKPSEEGVDKARKRDYETPDGKKGTKWEVPYVNWTGKILGVVFKESEYGETCTIEFDDAYLQVNTASRYFSDLASKFKNIDLSKDVTLHPYDFEADGKRKVGVSVQQDGVKLSNFYYDGKESLHGFPKVDEEKKTKKTYWKIYFAEVAEFLIEELKKIEFPKSLEQAVQETFVDEPEKVSEEDLDLPF